MKKRFICVLAAIAFALPAAACTRVREKTALSEDPPAETVAPALPEEPVREPTSEEEETQEPVREPSAELPVQTVQPQAPKRAKYLKVTASALTVRSGAGTGYSALGSAEKDVLLLCAGETDGWYETAYRGKKAYVSAKYAQIVSLETEDEKIEAVIEEGLHSLGTPYVYGATRLHDGRGTFLKGFTTNEFDCSSLMQYIFYRGAGVLLNVTTRTQILQGEAVEKDSLRRGDLMFFTNASRKNNTGIERVGHVALYLGDGYILHTASDYAKIEKLSALRWSYFIQARRMG